MLYDEILKPFFSEDVPADENESDESEVPTEVAEEEEDADESEET